jgi:hypothetical protein
MLSYQIIIGITTHEIYTAAGSPDILEQMTLKAEPLIVQECSVFSKKIVF